ncbi:hypothetical protein BC739_009381 [Kutzneria viridogrisea]|uniref:Uncharacterized protein n=1 Tax=Kutzneria viridogrisea TaxID=47990 RepID=A0ABR6BZU6_9PSEU|nr:hypothetical protein [Kutzneria viridogrisea]
MFVDDIDTGQEYAGMTTEPGQPSKFDLDQINDWAYKHHFSRQAIRNENYNDVEGFVRRLRRLRGGILDLLPREAYPGQVRDILIRNGITYQCLPEDLADMVGLKRGGGA